MNDISGIIVARDNPKHLFESIESMEPLVKELIIADIGLEKTAAVKLSKNKKITVIPIDESVPYVELIREKLKKYAHGEYLLILDPDEVIPSVLADQLRSVYMRYDYISIPRKNIIFNKWIQHSRWWPDYQIRLFKKDSVTWPKKIHCQPEAKGTSYSIEPSEDMALIHYNYDTVDDYFSKAVRYAKSEAAEIAVQKDIFTLSQALKTALSEFISRYFSDQGYKDGMHGFILSFSQMFYYFLVYSYYWEIKKYPETELVEEQQAIDGFFRDALFSVQHWQSKDSLTKSNLETAIKQKLLNKLLQK